MSILIRENRYEYFNFGTIRPMIYEAYVEMRTESSTTSLVFIGERQH